MCYLVGYGGSTMGLMEDWYTGYDACHAAVRNSGVVGDVTGSCGHGVRACGYAKTGNYGSMLVATGPVVHGEGGEQSLVARALIFFFTISVSNSHFSRFSLAPLYLSTPKNQA